MTHTYVFWSPKGGQGCTLIATSVALGLADQGHSVLVVDLHGDVMAMLGSSTNVGIRYDVYKQLTVCDDLRFGLQHGWDFVIVDAGITPEECWITFDHLIAVVRGDYLALRRAVQPHYALALRHTSHVVVLEEAERALKTHDASSVLNKPVAATLGVSPAIARIVDAGVLPNRRPKAVEAAVSSIFQVVA